MCADASNRSISATAVQPIVLAMVSAVRPMAVLSSTTMTFIVETTHIDIVTDAIAVMNGINYGRTGIMTTTHASADLRQHLTRSSRSGSRTDRR